MANNVFECRPISQTEESGKKTQVKYCILQNETNSLSKTRKCKKINEVHAEAIMGIREIERHMREICTVLYRYVGEVS